MKLHRKVLVHFISVAYRNDEVIALNRLMGDGLKSYITGGELEETGLAEDWQ